MSKDYTIYGAKTDTTALDDTYSEIIDKADAKNLAGVNSRKRPSYRAKIEHISKEKQSPEGWIANELAMDWSPEYPLAGTLIDTAAGRAMKLHSLKLMHLIYATAYRDRAQTVTLSKKAMRTFLRSNSPQLKKAVDDLSMMQVTIAASGYRNGSKPIRTSILEYTEERHSITFTLADTIFTELDDPRHFYRHIDLKSVYKITSVNALGIYPLLKHNSDLKSSMTMSSDKCNFYMKSAVRTYSYNQLGLMMQFINPNSNAKVYDSKVFERFVLALENLIQNNVNTIYIDEDRILATKQNVSIDIQPGLRTVQYTKTYKKDAKLFTLKAPTEYFIEPSRFINIVKRRNLTLSEASATLVHNCWIVFLYENRTLGESFTDIFEAFENYTTRTGFVALSEYCLREPMKYWDSLTGNNNEYYYQEEQQSEPIEPRNNNDQDSNDIEIPDFLN